MDGGGVSSTESLVEVEVEGSLEGVERGAGIGAGHLAHRKGFEGEGPAHLR